MNNTALIKQVQKDLDVVIETTRELVGKLCEQLAAQDEVIADMQLVVQKRDLGRSN